MEGVVALAVLASCPSPCADVVRAVPKTPRVRAVAADFLEGDDFAAMLEATPAALRSDRRGRYGAVGGRRTPRRRPDYAKSFVDWTDAGSLMAVIPGLSPRDDGATQALFAAAWGFAVFSISGPVAPWLYLTSVGAAFAATVPVLRHVHRPPAKVSEHVLYIGDHAWSVHADVGQVEGSTADLGWARARAVVNKDTKEITRQHLVLSTRRDGRALAAADAGGSSAAAEVIIGEGLEQDELLWLASEINACIARAAAATSPAHIP